MADDDAWLRDRLHRARDHDNDGSVSTDDWDVVVSRSVRRRRRQRAAGVVASVVALAVVGAIGVLAPRPPTEQTVVGSAAPSTSSTSSVPPSPYPTPDRPVRVEGTGFFLPGTAEPYRFCTARSQSADGDPCVPATLVGDDPSIAGNVVEERTSGLPTNVVKVTGRFDGVRLQVEVIQRRSTGPISPVLAEVIVPAAIGDGSTPPPGVLGDACPSIVSQYRAALPGFEIRCSAPSSEALEIFATYVDEQIVAAWQQDHPTVPFRVFGELRRVG